MYSADMMLALTMYLVMVLSPANLSNIRIANVFVAHCICSNGVMSFSGHVNILHM